MSKQRETELCCDTAQPKALNDEYPEFVSFSDDIKTPEDAFRLAEEKQNSLSFVRQLLEASKVIKTTDDASLKKLLEHELEESITNEGIPPLVANVYREMFRHICTDDVSRLIMDMFNEALENPVSNGKVKLLPMMCGLGKSSAITYKIFDTLTRDDNDGLLILTDRKERLNKYFQTDHYPALSSFFEEHRDEICLITGDTIAEEITKQQYCKVLLMTTQHFYNLPLSEVNRLTTWGTEKHPRSLVLFDEDPDVARIIDISRADLDEVATAIQEGLPASPSFAESKQFCVGFWNQIRDIFLSVSDHLDHENAGKAFSYFQTFDPPDKSELKRFLKLINENKDDLNSYRNRPNSDQPYTTLKNTLLLFDGPVLVSARDDASNQKTSFSILQDRSDHINALLSEQTHVFILDGTAHISPNYDIHPDLYDGSAASIDRDLDTLRIHVMNKKCGSSTLRRMKAAERTEFVSEIKGLAQSYATHSEAKTGVFTYMHFERYFRTPFGSANIGHFEDLAGRNEFNKLSVIVQVGLNHFAPEKYILYTIAIDPAFRDELYLKTQEEQNEAIQQEAKCKQSKTQRIMLRFICADIEQNLFRGKIRFYHVRNEVFGSAQNAVNDEYHFILCFSFDFYPQVIQMLKDRFEPLHAQIDILEESALSVVKGYLKTLAASNISYKETGLCSFVNVLRTFDASQEFTTADLKQAMGYNDSQLHDLRKVKIAKLIFDKITVKKGTYRVGTLFTEEWMKLL